MQWLHDAGFSAVQLDATLAGTRPRELGQRARRDLLALAGRRDLRIAGVDLFLPRSHYVEDRHQDRAVGATLAAIELAADLGRVPLSVTLPITDLAPDIRAAMVQSADVHGVRLAVHAEDQPAELLQWAKAVDLPALGVALDPAAVLARSQSPPEVARQAGQYLAVARLSDLTSATAVRCRVGDGDLDLAEYRVAVDLAPGRTGPVVLDLRGIESVLDAAIRARRAWDDAAFAV
jgi:sugar phosphate isomerase/epimerase